MRGGARQDVECKGQETIAHQNGSCVIEGHVNGRPPAAQNIIVHRRQIVMHQGIAMNALDRSARHQGALARDTEELGRCEGKKGTQALATAQSRIAHGLR